jgi:hypothetical protein
MSPLLASRDDRILTLIFGLVRSFIRRAVTIRFVSRLAS